jgi:hypothetical protein
MSALSSAGALATSSKALIGSATLATGCFFCAGGFVGFGCFAAAGFEAGSTGLDPSGSAGDFSFFFPPAIPNMFAKKSQLPALASVDWSSELPSLGVLLWSTFSSIGSTLRFLLLPKKSSLLLTVSPIQLAS